MWKVEGYTDQEIANSLNCVVRTVGRKLYLIRRAWRTANRRQAELLAVFVAGAAVPPADGSLGGGGAASDSAGLDDVDATVDVARPDTSVGGKDATLDVVKYIVLNPVRAGLCASAIEYPYLGSSGYDLSQLVTAADWTPLRSAEAFALRKRRALG